MKNLMLLILICTHNASYGQLTKGVYANITLGSALDTEMYGYGINNACYSMYYEFYTPGIPTGCKMYLIFQTIKGDTMVKVKKYSGLTQFVKSGDTVFLANSDTSLYVFNNNTDTISTTLHLEGTPLVSGQAYSFLDSNFTVPYACCAGQTCLFLNHLSDGFTTPLNYVTSAAGVGAITTATSQPYPNPTTRYINVTFGHHIVTDMLGRNVYSGYTNSIDLNNVPPGIYRLHDQLIIKK